MPRLPHRQGATARSVRRSASQRRARARMGRTGHPGLLRHASAARLPRREEHQAGHEVFTPAQVRASWRPWTSWSFPRSIPTAATSAWSGIRGGGKTGGRHPRGAGRRASAWTSTATFPSCGASTGTSRPTRWRAFKPSDYESYVGPRPASEPETRERHLAPRSVSEYPIPGRPAQLR